MERLRKTTYLWAGWFGVALGVAHGYWLILTLEAGMSYSLVLFAPCTVVLLATGTLFIRRSRQLTVAVRDLDERARVP